MENIELWRGKARISWYMQFYSLLFYGVIVIFILAAPMPSKVEPVWLFLLVITLYFAFLSQKRLISMGGEIILRNENGLKLIYNLDEWSVENEPLILKGMILFRLRSLAEKKDRYLLLAHDNMTREAWSSFAEALAQYFESAKITPSAQT